MAEHFDPQQFIHENDAKALNALKAIPGFDQFVKAFMKVFNERTMKIMNMSGKVRLDEQQGERIYNLLLPICEKMNIPVPELYLELDPFPNAYTYGDTTVFITVTSGLLKSMTDEEIQAVLAHECGHIVCHHVLYRTMGSMLLNGAVSLLGLPPILLAALEVPFYYWMRCSEFSADRAAAYFYDDSQPVVDIMLRLAGASTDLGIEFSPELFMQQAKEYEEYLDDSGWNKLLEALIMLDKTHPFAAVRAASITKWWNDPKPVPGEPPVQEEPPVQKEPPVQSSCPHCGTQYTGKRNYCTLCGTRLS